MRSKVKQQSCFIRFFFPTPHPAPPPASTGQRRKTITTIETTTAATTAAATIATKTALAATDGASVAGKGAVAGGGAFDAGRAEIRRDAGRFRRFGRAIDSFDVVGAGHFRHRRAVGRPAADRRHLRHLHRSRFAQLFENRTQNSRRFPLDSRGPLFRDALSQQVRVEIFFLGGGRIHVFFFHFFFVFLNFSRHRFFLFYLLVYFVTEIRPFEILSQERNAADITGY